MWGNPREQFRQSWRFEKINADTPVWIDGRRLDKCLSGYFFWYSLTVHLLMVDWCCFIIRNSLEALNFYVVDARFKVSMCHRPIHRYKPLLMYAASPMPSVVGMRNKWRLIVTVNSLLISIEEIWRLLWRRSSQHRRQGFAGHPNVCRSVSDSDRCTCTQHEATTYLYHACTCTIDYTTQGLLAAVMILRKPTAPCFLPLLEARHLSQQFKVFVIYFPPYMCQRRARTVEEINKKAKLYISS